jgi:hypothetical protein
MTYRGRWQRPSSFLMPHKIWDSFAPFVYLRLISTVSAEYRGKQVEVSQYFTGSGLLGAILFVAGWLVGTIGWYLLVTTPHPSSAFTLILLGGGAFAVLISIPMMIVGRAYYVTLDRIPKDKIS